MLSEHSSGGGGGGGSGGGNDYSAMFSTPPPHKVSPPGPGDLDSMSCSSSSLLGASGGTAGGHRYPTGPEPTNTATSVYNTTPRKYVARAAYGIRTAPNGEHSYVVYVYTVPPPNSAV